MAQTHSSLFPYTPPGPPWFPAEVPSVQDVHASSRVPWMSLGREAPASSEKLGGSPRPGVLKMEVEGGGEWLREDGERWV